MKTWFIADTHFGHENIIGFCGRPFESVEAMNRTIMNNWNSCVNHEDTVFHLGDVRYGRDSSEAAYYLSHLRGNIILLKGSHDRDKEHKMLPFAYYLSAGSYKFLLVHDCTDVNWDGWIICGHSHNLRPLVDLNHRVVCVSAENINYTPIRLDVLLNRIEEAKRDA